MERLQVNSKGRTFVKGCALSRDLRILIIDEIVRNGGNINTGYFPGKFSDVENTFKVSGNTVKTCGSVYRQNVPLNQGAMEEETPLI